MSEQKEHALERQWRESNNMMQEIESKKLGEALTEKDRLIHDLAKARGRVAELESERLALFRDNLPAMVADYLLPMLPGAVQGRVRAIADLAHPRAYPASQTPAVL